MTDSNGQQQMLDAIERLLAGETVDLEGLADSERQQLLQLARDLRDERPQPSADFEQRLERKIMQEAAATTRYAQKTDAGNDRQKKPDSRRWLPPWLTLGRVAAVSAALVIGLGIAGMTGALLQERGGNGVIDSGRVADLSAEKAAAPESGGYGPMGLDEDAAVSAAGPAAGSEMRTADGVAGGSGSIPSVRQVIQSADYEIEIATGEFQEKYRKVTDLATRYGGYVVSADTTASNEDGAINSGNITIRIADVDGNFTQAMSELDELGTVVSRQVSGEDVTDEFVDLQSRLRNAQSHEASLLGLMNKATTVEEMLMVEAELTMVRAEIEQLQGQINYIENRSDFATISVKLYEKDAADEDADNGDGTYWGFVDALEHSGWLAVQTVNFVIMALGVIIPVALMLTIVSMIVYRLVQRRR